MRMDELASLLLTSQWHGSGEGVTISGIRIDSRKVEPGDLFICLPGHTVDGHDYAAQAAERGAVALIVERPLPVKLPQLVVKDSRLAMSVLGSHYYGYPSEQMRMIGITGTNGKTTTTYLIERLLEDAGHRAGVIGTIEMRYGGRSLPMSGTTPESLDLQQSLADMAAAGMGYCVMEVSSHALEQGRVKGCRYRSAIFTNLTQDHLDYHETMDNYAAAKSLLFSRLGNSYAAEETQRSYSIINVDDPYGATLARSAATEVITYGIESQADVRASEITISAKGTSFRLTTFRGACQVHMRLVGKFNVYNALAAVAAGLVEGLELDGIRESLEQISGVPGRVEAVDAGQPYAVIVDYAHTPDGLDNVLKAVKEIAKGRVICVFGCGGDRDRTKRPMMGQIAASHADYVVVTSDNPRSEDPQRILEDIKAGLVEAGVSESRYVLEVDRRKAIKKAVDMASSDDVVLIAGKGHETYQIIGAETSVFDDREIAEQLIRSQKS
ncbi:UDP-N-acetylmuramoyl-L-alanyl-D-glutamate--2,6-diaminopimelate ligase [Paenibacillus daejeonensis]|uniref:UDP-N-acetylmuramoyl-L-alanyl-D-glutamate--2, 6-diaminopimelate ligase n=1 Tax=Paenibacillus daejeonensis TaxID=135193 RepID=UPI00037E79BB|nr:UDP-N-acetylmuramoyl-L-alanyl-D-glutamate--2,6-diaminopimelate ligase [Paenibacillus daejeonensis]